MLGKEDFMVIQALVQRGVYVCDIARQRGVHPKTVSRALARGSAPTPTRRRRKSRLDPYRAQVDQLLAEGVWNAQVIFREIQARGYTGKLSILRDYIRPKRALRPGRVTVRFETEPASSFSTARAFPSRGRTRSAWRGSTAARWARSPIARLR